MGLQAFKAIKYFIISGTNNKIGCLFTWVFWWVLLAGFLGGSSGPPIKTHRVFLGMYLSVWTLGGWQYNTQQKRKEEKDETIQISWLLTVTLLTVTATSLLTHSLNCLCKDTYFIQWMLTEIWWTYIDLTEDTWFLVRYARWIQTRRLWRGK